MNIVTATVRALSRSRLRRQEDCKRQPHVYQQTIFKSLLRAGHTTQFGQQYHFASLSTIAQFQQRVPLHEYDRLKPYIDRMRQGQQQVLWNTPVRWFAQSSGTTADKSKFIPVSRESLYGCHYQGARDVLMWYINRYPDTRMFNGKALTLGGSHRPEAHGRIRHGDLSAILIHNAPRYAEWVRTPSREIALCPDFETKVQRIAERTIRQNVTNFAGVPSWNLVLMKRILDISGKDNLLDIWPNLELFMHGGISFEPYREQYRRLIPSDRMHYLEIYNASEGFFALQDDPSDAGMLLLNDVGVFYEFIPMNRLADALAGSFTAFDTIGTVKTGVNYAMVITTNGGLWRYLIGDTIQFTATYPHKIKITGRTRHFINVFGEELIVDNAIAALKAACQATGAQVAHYTVAPIFMDATAKGSHEWLIEFDTPPPDIDAFADRLDAELCKVNSDYEAKRSKNTTLNRLTLTVLPAGAFYEWMRRRGKLGGQNKIPPLYNTRQYAEELKRGNEAQPPLKNQKQGSNY
ncbi:MAG: GH3 auxin-responsive promoter family protein [Prevotellaceae bacterium]|nr:GH3 auxin-responsive promoter family protein [Prevotellaceae bacterium]